MENIDIVLLLAVLIAQIISSFLTHKSTKSNGAKVDDVLKNTQAGYRKLASENEVGNAILRSVLGGIIQTQAPKNAADALVKAYEDTYEKEEFEE